MDKQAYFICFRELSRECLDDVNIVDTSQYVKQRSENWHPLRDQARVTGSTSYSATGMGTLKEQKEHNRKLVAHDVEVIDKLMGYFKYGAERNIHA